MNYIEVYFYKVNFNKDFLSIFSLFDDSFKKYVNQYKNSSKHITSMCGFIYLYKIYKNKGIDIKTCMLMKNEWGKPYINDLFFNISNTKHYIAIAISNSEIGIDFESLDNLIKKEDIYKLIFKDSKKEDALKTWTNYESYFKFLGKGFSIFDFKKRIDLPYIFQKFYQKDGKTYSLSICGKYLSDKNDIIFVKDF